MSRSQKCAWLALACAIAAACLLSSCASSSADSGTYTMPKATISASAATDGTIDVVENRTFSFEEQPSALVWRFDSLPEDAAITVNGVSVTRLTSDGVPVGGTASLPRESFSLSWREGGGPAHDAFSLDMPQNAVYVFLSAECESVTVTLSYTIEGAVLAYDDVADLNWEYVSSSWSAPTESVTMTLSLPVPQGQEAVAGRTVHAWFHGPAESSISMDESGAITFRAARVGAGQYAEARVLFPSEWLSNLGADSPFALEGEEGREAALDEERAWTDAPTRTAISQLGSSLAWGAAAVLLVLWALLCYALFGRAFKPRFAARYLAEPPADDLHPTLAGRVLRGGRARDADDFAAACAHLMESGAVRMVRGGYEARGLQERAASPVCDWYLVRTAAVASVADPIDRAALERLFLSAAAGTDAAWVGDAVRFAREHPERARDAREAWNAAVQSEMEARELVEGIGKKLQWVVFGVAVAFVIAGLAAWSALASPVPFALSVAAGVAMTAIANNLLRLSREGSELSARCEALRAWLLAFPASDEASGKMPDAPDDALSWRALAPYAAAFGSASSVAAGLRAAFPAERADLHAIADELDAAAALGAAFSI